MSVTPPAKPAEPTRGRLGLALACGTVYLLWLGYLVFVALGSSSR